MTAERWEPGRVGIESVTLNESTVCVCRRGVTLVKILVKSSDIIEDEEVKSFNSPPSVKIVRMEVWQLLIMCD